ncbi:MAG: 4Fe-4S dicluster domain-containing protein [Geminicoccaceae bacterium]
MRVGERRVMLCDCEATMPLDAEALARALGTETPAIATSLCRRQQARLAGEAPGIVACAQERALFEEVLAEGAGHDAAESLVTVDIRARAAWSREAAEATPKIAALLAEAALPVPETHVVTLESGGVTLVYGRDEVAIDAAAQLGDRLDVTVLLTRPGDVTPPRKPPSRSSRARSVLPRAISATSSSSSTTTPCPTPRPAAGSASAHPATRRSPTAISSSTSAAASRSSPRTRPGYLHADPADPVAVQKALLAATDLVGTFDKPRHVAYRPELCAHSRNRTVGCSRCLDVCPTGAITPNGDHVAIDAAICAGCGGCHAVCPTGAAAYDLPPADHLLERVRTSSPPTTPPAAPWPCCCSTTPSMVPRSSISSPASATACRPG